MEQFEFFWGGIYSQWYKASFSSLVPIEKGIEILIFNCAEQFMMYMKAATFGDWEIAKQILVTTNPKEQKALGRKVKNFDPVKWNEVARTIVYNGNYAKFTQFPELKAILLDTAGKTLVEASPYDKIWGIGLAAHDPRALSRESWQGRNWLGETLTKLRDQLIWEGNT